MAILAKTLLLFGPLLGACMLTVPLGAADQAFNCPLVKVDPNGTFAIHGLDFGVAIYQLNYAGVHQNAFAPDPASVKDAAASWECQSTLQPVEGTPMVMHEKLDRVDDTSFKYSLNAAGAGGSPLKVPNLLAFEVHLPAASFGGKNMQVDDQSITLPAKADQNSIFDKWGAQKVTLPVDGGTLTIEGDLKVHVQDDRLYQKDYFLFWIVVAKSDTPGTPVDLGLIFTYKPDAPAK